MSSKILSHDSYLGGTPNQLKRIEIGNENSNCFSINILVVQNLTTRQVHAFIESFIWQPQNFRLFTLLTIYNSYQIDSMSPCVCLVIDHG